LPVILFSTTFGRAHLSLGKAGVPMHVSIRIKGHLDQNWQQWLEGLQIVHEPDGTSRLSGRLQDQSALYGVLSKIDRLSLTLLSLERSETRPEES
jgi:hypothetical protein